jgi:hypothetical protein
MTGFIVERRIVDGCEEQSMWRDEKRENGMGKGLD